MKCDKQMCPLHKKSPEDCCVGECNDSHFLFLLLGIPAQNKLECNVDSVSNWLPFSRSYAVI